MSDTGRVAPYPKRLIEVDLPIKRISAHARREKSIRHGHISALHMWWARRPLAACRAVLCAALWPDPADEYCPQAFRDHAAQVLCDFAEKVRNDRRLVELCAESWTRWNRTTPAVMRPSNPGSWPDLRYALLDFIADFANWDASTVPAFLDAACALTQAAHEALGSLPGTRPLVVDPFAGGGSIPLETLRIGADAYASDLNPVAMLLNKVVLEYIPKYGNAELRMGNAEGQEITFHGLAEAVRYWGDWIREQAEEELAGFYPKDPDGATPIGYLWARTIVCEGPGCGKVVPIIRNQVISSRNGAEVAVAIGYDGNRLQTSVVMSQDARRISGGTSRRSSVTCPACGFTTPRTHVEVQANTRGFGHHLYLVCLRTPSGQRIYRQPADNDFAALQSAERALTNWSTCVASLDGIPDEELPYLRSIFNVRVYGIDRWSKLFTHRQLLSCLSFTRIIRRFGEQIASRIGNCGLAAALTECLALSVSNSFQYQCSIATYLTEGIKSAFIQGQSLPMKMDFVEANPLMDELAGGYPYSLSQHVSALAYTASFPFHPGTTQQVSALALPLPANAVDLVATDPPYYDVVPYADLSDFFYVWLRRMLHGITSFPTGDALTPKEDEIVQLAERNKRYSAKTKHWFEEQMRAALSGAQTAVKPSGLAVIVFAHKETAAWESLLQSVLSAAWMVTGSWPIDTEKSTRLRANDSAVLASSIHLVCRPRQGHTVGDWRDVLTELPVRVRGWLPRLAQEGVVGADAIFACIGPALEIYSRYERVEKPDGQTVDLHEYLEYVWAAVAREALSTIFEQADATGLEEDARLTAIWLWTLRGNDERGVMRAEQDAISEGDGEEENEQGRSSPSNQRSPFSLEYDAARKIAQGLGAHLGQLDHMVEIKGETARLRAVIERRRYLLGKEQAGVTPPRRGHKGQIDMFASMDQPDEAEVAEAQAPSAGRTVLDRVHQAMLLFGDGRSEALKRFLVEDGAGKDPRLWRLAQALSALYPATSEEKRWVDGILARKKGLGF